MNIGNKISWLAGAQATQSYDSYGSINALIAPGQIITVGTSAGNATPTGYTGQCSALFSSTN